MSFYFRLPVRLFGLGWVNRFINKYHPLQTGEMPSSQ